MLSYFMHGQFNNSKFRRVKLKFGASERVELIIREARWTSQTRFLFAPEYLGKFFLVTIDGKQLRRSSLALCWRKSSMTCYFYN